MNKVEEKDYLNIRAEILLQEIQMAVNHGMSAKEPGCVDRIRALIHQREKVCKALSQIKCEPTTSNSATTNDHQLRS